jgi:DNA-binding response OmpR family regulator
MSRIRKSRLRVDLARRRVFVGDTEVHLTPIEYRWLTTLVRHAGKVLTHARFSRKCGDQTPWSRPTTCAHT